MTEETKNNPVKEIIQISDELLDNITQLIQDQAEANILAILADLHPADIAEIINHLKIDDAAYIFNILDTETAGDVITELDDNLRERVLKQIDEVKISDIVDELDTDDATDVVSGLSDDVAERVLQRIDREDSDDVKELLKYPEDSAGGIMSSDFVYVESNASVKDAIEQVRINSEEFDHIYFIYVLKPDEELIGRVSLKSLLVNQLDNGITDVMEEDLIFVTPQTDQEEVAKLMEKYDLVSIPVADENKKMLGRITIDDIVDVIHDEASEDIQKIAGLSEEQESSDSIFRISRIRLPWLIIALIMEVIAAKLLQSFEESILNLVFATFFIPVVMAMGGSSGTQAAIVMVRGLSTGDVWIKDSVKKLSKEFLVAMLNGLTCGVILLIATRLLFENAVTFNFTILLSIALLVIIIFSTMVGAITPLVFKKFGTDPAIATGPFVTTTNDILGLLIYLSFVTIFYVA